MEVQVNRSIRGWAVAVLSVAVALAAAVYGERTPSPCQAEDGGPYPCLWDGPHRGNQRGHPVMIYGDD